MTRESPGRLPSNGQPPWFKGLIRAYFRMAFGRCEIRGIENVPAEGPLIIASTHRSYLDPLILGAFILRPLCFMSKSELFQNRLLSAFITAFGAFPVDRESVRGSTFRTAVNLLHQGEVVAVFPEGGIVDSLGEQGFKKGVGMLASMTGARVLPIYLSGTNTLFSWPMGLSNKTWMVLHAGELIEPGENRGRVGRNQISERVGEKLQELERAFLASRLPEDRPNP
ncbi:lysophospholipid acyltransferase family protein [Nitrospinota bacterium]